jgi:ectoine hydroxylase-related dioxygenase (phytanoyl-CoA dioxygenase family)
MNITFIWSKHKYFIMSIITQLSGLNLEHEIREADIEQFQKNGHILFRDIVSKEEMPVYRPLINEAAYKYNTEHRKMEERDTYGKAFLQVMNLWTVSNDVARFTLARRFARLAAQLLGVENVRLYHDQALYKEPGGGLTPWHQDQYYWPIDTAKTITMWMPLVDISEQMGMLTFASGSHQEGFIENIGISDQSQKILSEFIENRGYPVTCADKMNAGDATWHLGWTLHSAPPNTSAQTREVMTVIYIADGARVITPKNDFQEKDRLTWLMGRGAGELVDSSINPLLL